MGFDTGIEQVGAGGKTSTRVPVVVRARVELEAELATGVTFRTVLLPAFGSGQQPNEPFASLGLQEAHVDFRSDGVDIVAGFQRLPLTQLRLLEPVTIEPRLRSGEPRGPLAVTALGYAGSWRVRGAVIGVRGDDLVPREFGGLASVRFESALVTVEGHALWTVRPAAGLTASASVDALVLYGEGWLLARPWSFRGGLGASGYVGDWLWTAEAGWAPAIGRLRSPARPAVAANLSRPLGLSGSVEVTLLASWPRSLLEPEQRANQLDALVTLAHDQGNAFLSVTPAFHLSEGVTAGSLDLSLRAYF
ncbi:MAG TPA: hypothetical protein VF168_06140 [Trueperaceae bacterium]